MAGAGLTLFALSLGLYEAGSVDRRLTEADEARSAVDQAIAELEGSRARLAEGREALARLETEERRLARWDEERFVLPQLLRELALRIATGVVLEELRREGRGIWITGRAGSGDQVSSATRSVAGIDRFRTVDLLWVERAEDLPAPANQRFAISGDIRFNSREPEPFALVEPAQEAHASRD